MRKVFLVVNNLCMSRHDIHKRNSQLVLITISTNYRVSKFIKMKVPRIIRMLPLLQHEIIMLNMR